MTITDAQPTCRRCTAPAKVARETISGYGPLGYCRNCDPLADVRVAPFFKRIQ